MHLLPCKPRPNGGIYLLPKLWMPYGRRRGMKIYLNSKNKNLWQNKIECTDEALCAVRDYLIQECLGGLHGDRTSGGYKWTLEDGRVVKLLVEIVDGGDNNEVD